MKKVLNYKKQIFTFVAIFLLLEFGVFPCLTMANTFANIVGAIGLVSLLIWAVIELFEAIKEPSQIETAIKDDLKIKPKPKHKSSKKSEFPIEPHSKTVKSTKSKAK